MGMADYSDALLLLQICNASLKLFHSSPVHLRPEMVFGVITVIKEQPVVQFPVAADAPRDRFIRVPAEMQEIAVQIG